MNLHVPERLRYLLAFVAIFVASFAVYTFSETWLQSYYDALARSVCWFFGWFDSAVSCAQNYLLYEGTRVLVVVEGCDGVTFVLLILAAVLPVPTTWWNRLVGLLTLVAAVLVVNWLRLVVLAGIRFYLPGAFDFVHVYLFQPFMIAFTLLLFFAWISSSHATPQEA